MLIEYFMPLYRPQHTYPILHGGRPRPRRPSEEPVEERATSREKVFLLHGLARTSRSMLRMGRHLAGAGYLTIPVDYPSRRQSIARSVVTVRRAMVRHLATKGATLHFVTHSMGGIVLRQMFEEYLPDNLGRVVMLSPPNQGSEIVDRFRDRWLFKAINGPAGIELGTDRDSLPNRLGPVRWPTGIIAGNRPDLCDIWLARFIPGESDGKVAVKRTMVQGMSDFLIVPTGHCFIMNNREVIRQTLFFLQNGRFDRNDTTT